MDLRIVAATLALLVCVPAQAELITFEFDIGISDCTGGVCPTLESFGVAGTDPFNYRLIPASGRFTVDTSAPDMDVSADSGFYKFSGGGTGLSITLGNLTLFAGSFEIRVVNDRVQSVLDCDPRFAWDVVAINSSIMHTSFLDCSAKALSSDALMHEAADVSLLGDAHCCPPLGIEGPGWSLQGGTSALRRVPEPSVLALLILALFITCVSRLPRHLAWCDERRARPKARSVAHLPIALRVGFELKPGERTAVSSERRI